MRTAQYHRATLIGSQRILGSFSPIASKAVGEIRNRYMPQMAATALLPDNNPARTQASMWPDLRLPRPGGVVGVSYAAWNCSASVEPDRATVSAFGEIAEVTRSK